MEAIGHTDTSLLIGNIGYSILEELSGGAACADGHCSISEEIVDDTIYSFPNGAGPISTSVIAT